MMYFHVEDSTGEAASDQRDVTVFKKNIPKPISQKEITTSSITRNQKNSKESHEDDRRNRSRKRLESRPRSRLVGGNEIRHGMLASASASASIKSDSTDLVTESDRKCEEIITRHVLYEFPTEEKTVIMNSTMTRPVRSTRLVTPIKKYCVFISHSLFSSSFATDGTANFCPKNTFGMRLVGLLH
jgi:hypothetical protein